MTQRVHFMLSNRYLIHWTEEDAHYVLVNRYSLSASRNLSSNQKHIFLSIDTFFQFYFSRVGFMACSSFLQLEIFSSQLYHRKNLISFHLIWLTQKKQKKMHSWMQSWAERKKSLSSKGIKSTFEYIYRVENVNIVIHKINENIFKRNVNRRLIKMFRFCIHSHFSFIDRLIRFWIENSSIRSFRISLSVSTWWKAFHNFISPLDFNTWNRKHWLFTTFQPFCLQKIKSHIKLPRLNTIERSTRLLMIFHSKNVKMKEQRKSWKQKENQVQTRLNEWVKNNTSNSRMEWQRENENNFRFTTIVHRFRCPFRIDTF